MRRLLFTLVLVLAAVAAAAAGFLWHDYVRPGPLAEPASVVVVRGSGLSQIARQMEAAGIVRHWPVFLAAARLRQQDGHLKAGEYAFEPQVSVRAAVEKMQRGETVVRRVTIAEGLTSAEALRRIAEADGLVGEAPSVPEGRLLPDTYHYSLGDDRAELVERMRRSMDAAVERLWRERPPDFPLSSPEQLLTLASIVEKETGVAAERARVAAVFLNRLARGMKLQSDPTVIYALTEGRHAHGRPLTRDDLKVESPYNTYRVEGLPPGPIANPGIASLQAVLKPAVTDELYFVADGNGGHVFAESLPEHNRNVVKWRRLLRERAQAADRVPEEAEAAPEKAAE